VSKNIKYCTVNKALNCLIVFLFAFTSLTAPLITPNLSYAKYVLDPIEETITVNSAATYNITAIGEISGTARVGEALTAGIVTPAAATVTYQWQRSDTDVGTYEDIPGATSNIYTLAGNDYDNYIRVVATGSGYYSGEVTSTYKGPVEVGLITAIGEIDGTARVGSSLTAGTLTPEEATAVYQWQRSSDEEGTYVNIMGATLNNYTLTVSDYDCYIRVVATGTDNYTGTATSAYKGPVAAEPITAIGEIDGAAEVGSILTAGTLTPEEATAVYQWQRSNSQEGPFTNITGAEASTYTVTAGDAGYYIKVTATGSGAYTGTVESAYIGPVEEVTPEITAIGPISGDARVGVMLTAGTLTPAEATAEYKWQRSSTEGGVYADIAGATSNTYTLTESDYNCYIRIFATATGEYIGTAISASKGPVEAGIITAIGPIGGTTSVGKTLTAGTLTPFGATAIYQWQRSNGTSAFSNIASATSSTYTLTTSDFNCYIRVVATGSGVYTGTVTSEFVGKVSDDIIALSSMAPIGGNAEVGQVLTAGTLSPTGAMATYQWQRASSAGGTYTSIAGATANSYTLAPEDKDKYIRVLAIGAGTYSGTLTSAAKGPVAAGQLTAIGPIAGTTAVGQTLTAGTLTPVNATVTYQWQRATITNGAYEDIENANASTYTLKASDENYFVRVIAVASGTFTGSAISAYTGPVSMTTTPITAIGAISGIIQVNQTMTAGPVEPAGATVTYQWLRCNTKDGVYESIPGATFNTLTVTTADMGKYFKVRVTGSGNYTGTVTSEYKGPAVAGEITAIGLISGTTKVGNTLAVGTLTPFGATASYQWQRSNGTSAFTDIIGGTASSYNLTNSDFDCYIRVVATGTGAFTGTVVSDYVGRVGGTITPITSIGSIGGTTTVGQTLTAGTVSPTGAIVTYQWQRAATQGGTYGNILGATANNYTLTAADKDQYIRVAAIGSGNYTGTVTSASKGPVTAGQLTAIGPINGTTTVGQTLTAGTLTPNGTTVDYQWQSCPTTNGTYENMLNANASTYTLKTSDAGLYIRVVARATGASTGTAISAYTGPVGATPTLISSIGEISGIAQVNRTLTAGPVDPAGATVTYQWLRSDSDVGTFENIPGETSDTYTLTAADLNKYFKVQAVGSGTYTGTVTSASKGPVTAGAITAIGPISGTTKDGATLTVGTLTPFGATASYQWQRASLSEPFVDIVGGTASSYTLTWRDGLCYIRVVATGTGAYTGTVISDYVGQVLDSVTPLTSIGPIGGTAAVGEILTAGTVSPTGAIVTYQWQNAETADGVYGNILGATASTYTPTAADKGKFIKVVVTGAGKYSGSVTSAYKGPVEYGRLTAIGPISGTTVVGQTLMAGTLTPSNATVGYQWQKCASANGTYENMSNANASAYTLKTSDAGFFIKVFVTATGSCTGTAISAYTGPVSTTAAAITPVTAIGAISGTAQVSQTLTAGTVEPAGATVTYQWLSCNAATGVYANIPGATSSTYTLTAADLNKYLQVQAIGSGTYTGTATSEYKGPVTASAITAIGAISGTTKVGQTLTVGTLTPYSATASYQWQRARLSQPFEDIMGGTASSYTLMWKDDQCYIRVVATGTGAYTGTVISDSIGQVVDSDISLTSIGAISGTAQIGETLVAGSLSPAGSKATYQWQSADTSGGVYGNILGATANSYALTAADKDKFIKVVATGSGNYSGTVTSAYKGPVEDGLLTAIGPISGTTVVGQTLTAGVLTPANATVGYQWKSCANPNGVYEDIENANASTYALQTSDEGRFIRVFATGAGSFTGSAISAYTGPVSSTIAAVTAVTAIGTISGTAQVAQTLTAGTVYPSGATVTYQWLRSDNDVGTYEIIPGATSNYYTLTAAEMNKYIKVQVIGSGTYTGTATSAYKGPVTAGVLTAIGAISGTTKTGQTLTVGTLTPYGATAVYQWQRSSASGFIDITGGTTSSYTLMWADDPYYIRVKATGTGAYTGTVYSDQVGRVSSSSTPLNSIGTIDGVAKVGEVLTAGPLSPAGTATYQWMRAVTAGGIYENIQGATAISYTLTAADKDKFIRVAATGNGSFSGTVISVYKGPITYGQITAIGDISGTTVVGQTLAAGALTPLNATVEYQWQRCDTEYGDYEDILNAASISYTLKDIDEEYYIKLIATGTGAYTGIAESNPTGPVGTTMAQITSVGAISGAAQVAQTLTAGTVDPFDATVTYQWLRCNTSAGSYEEIPGATSSTYTLAAADYNQYVKVQVAGAGSYSGTASSASIGPVAAGQITAISNIIGTTLEEQTLTAGTVSPLGATVTYQWLFSYSANGAYSNIAGATSNTYTLTWDGGKYIKVRAIGSGAFTGSAISAYTGPVINKNATNLVSIGAITGIVQAGETLTAGTLAPTGATATYQWQHCDTSNGDFANILGATSSTYAISESYKGQYIKVKATGSGNYTGTMTSTPVGPVTTMPNLMMMMMMVMMDETTITDIDAIDGKALIGSTLEAGALNPSDATAAYQWQRCDTADGTFEDIAGADKSSYTLTDLDESKYIRIVATGTDFYTGTVTSAAIGPVEPSTPITAINAINGTTQVGRILEAGTLNPSDAEATYQWQSCDTADGIFENIVGAEASTYTLTDQDEMKYVRVVATGTNGYMGTITSAAIGPVEPKATITAIGEINGIAQVGRTLEAGTLNPSDAEATYQWQSCDTADGIFENIVGAEASTYTLTDQYETKYVRVVATGTGAYMGTVTSAVIGPVEPKTPVTSIGEISGINQVGETLIAGTLDPPEATAVYQWQRSVSESGIFTDIVGATSNTYLLTVDDYNNYIRVIATGTGGYTGTVASAYVGPIIDSFAAVKAAEAEAAAKDAAAKAEAELVDQEAGDQEVGDQEVGGQEVGDQEVGGQEVGDQEVGGQEVGDQEAGDQEAGDQEAGDQEAGDQEAVDQEVVDQEVVDQEVVDQEVEDQEVGNPDAGTEANNMI